MLIIEDGSIVANANSFVTDAELTVYADARGIAYPAIAAERENLLILAVDYLFSKEIDMQGLRVSALQELPYPRVNVSINNFAIDSSVIPKNLKNAQIELALQANVSGLLVNDISSNVTREKIDVLEVEYNNNGKWSTVRTERANAYLLPLLKRNNNSLMARV